jgi:hypothetical protein
VLDAPARVHLDGAVVAAHRDRDLEDPLGGDDHLGRALVEVQQLRGLLEERDDLGPRVVP